MSGTGLFLPTSTPTERAAERAALAESLGYSSIWIAQVGDREATIVAAAAFQATSSIVVGTGVLPTYPRSPAVMAQTATTLDEHSGGRFVLGLGPSHKITIESWHGIPLDRPLLSVREYVGAIRAIMKGEPYAGDIYNTTFQFFGFEPPRRDLPIYLSCLSPKMCRLAGEVADGAVLWMCAPSYIEKVIVPAIEAGRSDAGLSMEGFEIVAAVPVSLTEDFSGGRNAFRSAAAIYWNLPFYRAAVARGGFEAALEAFDREGPPAIPDDVVDAFAGAGDEQACRHAAARYVDAGVTIPALSPLPRHPGSASFEETIKALA